MQQPKIEVRARDERRRDEVCAKWSTVERERERGVYEVLWGGGGEPDGKQNKGKAQENEERRKMRGEELNN